MDLEFTQDEPESDVEKDVYNALGGSTISEYLPEGYEEYVDTSTLRANYLEVSDGAVSVYVTNVTVGVQRGEGKPVEVNGTSYDFVVKPN